VPVGLARVEGPRLRHRRSWPALCARARAIRDRSAARRGRQGVSGFAVGDRVAVPFILSCGGCRECARGRPTICEDQEQPGFTRFGSFAEFVSLPRADRNLAHLPAEVSFEAAAALGCRGTTAYRAVVQQGRLGEGESVAVFGCGGLGLSCVMMAKAHGAAHQHPARPQGAGAAARRPGLLVG
jgi:D-arabinose 1-dehydrogenase-like Zn-dependent alcohol dehydrogenase